MGLRIEASALLLGALGILMLPLEWFFSAILAASVHELGHFLCARILKVPIFSVTVSAGGCRMEPGFMTGPKEFFCASAGPLASLGLACFIRKMPVLGICGLVQGLFNLLPVYPMDGGRMLRSLAGEGASKVVSMVTAFCLAGLGIAMSILENMGPVPGLFGWILLSKQNISCKSGKLTVK